MSDRQSCWAAAHRVFGRLLGLLIAACMLSQSRLASAQLDQTCMVSALNRTAPVQADGPAAGIDHDERRATLRDALMEQGIACDSVALVRAVQEDSRPVVRSLAAELLTSLTEPVTASLLRARLLKDTDQMVLAHLASDLLHLERGAAIPLVHSTLEKLKTPADRLVVAGPLAELGDFSAYSDVASGARSDCEPILDTTEEQYDRVLAINLKSAFFGTQLAARQMIQQGGGGRIINISSVHEDWPMPGNTAYCLAKGGMRMLTRTAGIELAPHKILVVGVAPGAVATPINLSTTNDPVRLKQLESAIPLGRLAQPEEIAALVGFLAGDGAGYMTATTVFADGGIMHNSVGL